MATQSHSKQRLSITQVLCSVRGKVPAVHMPHEWHHSSNYKSLTCACGSDATTVFIAFGHSIKMKHKNMSCLAVLAESVKKDAAAGDCHGRIQAEPRDESYTHPRDARRT